MMSIPPGARLESTPGPRRGTRRHGSSVKAAWLRVAHGDDEIAGDLGPRGPLSNVNADRLKRFRYRLLPAKVRKCPHPSLAIFRSQVFSSSLHPNIPVNVPNLLIIPT